MSEGFRRVIANSGLTPPEYFTPGKFQRFPGLGKHHGNTSGWCKQFEDGTGGIFGDWSTGIREVWQEKRELSETERREFVEQVKKARQEAEREREKTQQEAAKNARNRWFNAQPENGEHRYLRDKGIDPHDIRSDGFNLLIPMYDTERNLCSIQSIDPNGKKRFQKGGRVKGCYYPIGKPNGVLCLAEGFATAATIHEATGHAVAVCFNAENIQPVAKSLSRNYPDTQFIICADDDYKTEGNPGITKALAAAGAIDGARVVKPEFGESRPEGATDFNDMAIILDKEAVRRMFDASENDPIKPNTFDWTEDFTVSTAEAENYDNPEWLYENLIIRGHVIAIPAPPNGGKTTIMMHVASELARNGLSVFYVNADVGQSDAKSMVTYADDNAFKLLLPDMKLGRSMQDVVERLTDMNATGGDFSSSVWIFDTLKKMTDVITKSRAKELYKLLRSLSAKGMTIILLAHTNKYNDNEGKPIYEGTGDLRSDVDELIYFIPEKHENGSMTVSTEPDKTRGKFKPITFNIDPERNVHQDEYVDIISKMQNEKRLDENSPIIEAVVEAIEAGKFRQTEIIEYCGEMKIAGRNKVHNVLKAYSSGPNQKWIEKRGFQNNVKVYRLINEGVLPQNQGYK